MPALVAVIISLAGDITEDDQLKKKSILNEMIEMFHCERDGREAPPSLRGADSPCLSRARSGFGEAFKKIMNKSFGDRAPLRRLLVAGGGCRTET